MDGRDIILANWSFKDGIETQMNRVVTTSCQSFLQIQRYRKL